MTSPAPPVHLEWVAPEGCPTQDEIVGAIARIVGTSELGTAVDARVVITKDEREFRAEATVSASRSDEHPESHGRVVPRRRRRCGARGCARSQSRPYLRAAARLFPRPWPPGGACAVQRGRRIGAGSSPLRRVFFVEAAFLVDSGLLPSVGLGGELAAGWSPVHLDLEIVGAFLGTQRIELASTPTQGANVWLAHLGGRACYELFDARLDVGPCLGGGVEWITAHGFGSVHPEDSTGEMVVGSLGARGVFHVSSRIVLRIAGEALVPLARPTFVIDGAGQVFQASGASFRASAGLEAHF